MAGVIIEGLTLHVRSEIQRRVHRTHKKTARAEAGAVLKSSEIGEVN